MGRTLSRGQVAEGMGLISNLLHRAALPGRFDNPMRKNDFYAFLMPRR